LRHSRPGRPAAPRPVRHRSAPPPCSLHPQQAGMPPQQQAVARQCQQCHSSCAVADARCVPRSLNAASRPGSIS
jgi:hypothetical protein